MNFEKTVMNISFNYETNMNFRFLNEMNNGFRNAFHDIHSFGSPKYPTPILTRVDRFFEKTTQKVFIR
jgi:hypothetical protein